jgi:hypothetical protein
MNRSHFYTLALLSVLCVCLCGCGGFNGILTPTLATITPSTVAAGSEAFTITATGTNFVNGSVLLWDGNSLPTTMSSSTQLTAKVGAAQIAAAGTISIRVMKPDTTTSGTLTLTVSGSPAPSPFSLSSISPAAVAAGSSSFTLTATGVGFVSGASITVNGAAVATTFDSSTQLHAAIAASQVATAGAIAVGVTNPDKSTTKTVPLTVFAEGGLGPAPTLTSLSPDTSPNGISAELALTTTGTNFVNGSKVFWNGAVMKTTFVSSTQLTASIPTTYFGTTSIGTSNVFVLNPDSTASNRMPFTITISPLTTPTLVSIANPLGINRSQVNDPAFTLTLKGSLFASGAIACLVSPPTALTATPMCASDLPTTIMTSTTATAQFPASALTSVAETPVMIRNAKSKLSNPIPYYVGMNLYFDEAADVVWDSRYNLLYVSKPSTAQHNTDTIMAFSPNSGLTDLAAIWIYQLPAGSNPDRLALSASGNYLYVALDGLGIVQQLNITGASTSPTPGKSIALGSDPNYGPYYTLDMQVSPLSADTIAVARGIPPEKSHSTSLALGGVAIYDGTTQRPDAVGSSSVLLDNLQWSTDGNSIYASNNENASGDLYTLAVSASGVQLTGDQPGIFNTPNLYIHLVSMASADLIFGDDGSMVNLSSGARDNFVDNGIMIPDPSTGNAYFVAHPPYDPNVLEYFLSSYDLTTKSLNSTLDLYMVQGIPQHMVRWDDSSNGMSGLAFTTKKFNCLYTPCNVGDGRLYVINLPF